MPLRFPGAWRFTPPADGDFINAAIPESAVGEFFDVIDRLRNDNGRWSMLSFLKSFLYSGTTHTSGDRAPRIHWYIKYGDIDNFADSAQIENAIKDVSLEFLPEKSRLAIQEFHKAVKRKRDGKAEGVFGWDTDDD